MKKNSKLEEILGTRELPPDLGSQVFDISPYRKVVECSADGEYESSPILDSAPLPDFNSIPYIVSIKRFLTGSYPSDTAEKIALALFGLFPDFRGRTCLCIDANEVDVEGLATAIEQGNVELLYTDDEELASLTSPIIEEALVRMTYRNQIVWNGEIPPWWIERLAQEERFRRYNLSLSRTSSAVSKIFPEQQRYRMPASKEYSKEQLSQLVQLLGCGYVESDFPDVVPPVPLSSPIDSFIEHGVSFARIEPLLDSIETKGPDDDMLKGVIAIWREIAFKSESPKRADILALPLDEIADEYAIETYVDALSDGVPLEDLLA